jgi:hypothetical protein
LDKLRPLVKDEAGTVTRHCAWCYEGLLHSRNQKYCCEDCSTQANAWGYPQSDFGAGLLLMKQGFKCAGCQYDWGPLCEEISKDLYYGEDTFRTKFSWPLVSRLKYKVKPEHKPEVDHIVPISKGGEAIGLNNHQVLCYTCHKKKTKVDNSGPRVLDPALARERELKRKSEQMGKLLAKHMAPVYVAYEQKKNYGDVLKGMEEFWLAQSREDLEMLLEYESLRSYESSFKTQLMEYLKILNQKS